MRFFPMTQKAALDAVIVMLRRGMLGPRSELAHHADVLASIRDWVASVERKGAEAGRKTARDLSQAIWEDTRRGR